MIDLELLKDPIMLILCLSNLLGMMGFYIPFMFLKDLSNAMELDPTQAGLLVPIIGVTNTVGRIFFGWVADKKYLSALTINNLSLVICGILTLACPLLRTMGGQYFYAFFFGFIICMLSVPAENFWLFSSRLHLPDLHRSCWPHGIGQTHQLFWTSSGCQRNCVSRRISICWYNNCVCTLCFYCVFTGLVYDLTGSYDAAFYFGGMVILIAGLISCTIPFFLKRRGNADGTHSYYIHERYLKRCCKLIFPNPDYRWNVQVARPR